MAPLVGPGGQPFVPLAEVPTQSQYILQNRWVDPETGAVNYTTPPGYVAIPAPSGGGFLLVPPDYTAGSNQNLVRVQPPGTGSSSQWGYNFGYFVVYNNAGAAISIFSGQQFPANSPAVHNPFTVITPPSFLF